MTSQEWADAADRGNPETLGKALLRAVQQAHTEARESFASFVSRAQHTKDGAPDIGELAPNFDHLAVKALMTRAGELLREQGWIKP